MTEKTAEEKQLFAAAIEALVQLSMADRIQALAISEARDRGHMPRFRWLEGTEL